MRWTMVMGLILAAAVSSAEAQTRANVRGFGGVTFMSETAGVVGLSVGVQVRPHIEVLAEGGRLTNVLPHHLQRDLDLAARSFGSLYGAPLTIDGRAPAWYSFGAVRVSHTAGPRTRLYADVGAGAAHGTSDIRAVAGGRDVSASVVTALGIKASENAGLITAGAGLMLAVTDRLGIDVGYRFMRIFTDDPRINTPNISVGLRWGF